MRPIWGLTALAFLIGGASAPAAEPARFNLVSIVTDDQARWSLGAYGNREARTPNMDRLAREGAVFRNAFANTPVCSPSRASFLTGLYGTQLGITDYIADLEAAQGVGLAPSATTWPEILRQQGYATALIGKWHLGSQPRFHPQRRGFEHFFGFLGGASRPMNPVLERDGKEESLTGSLPGLLVDEAIRFVERRRSQPFALLLHFREPHTPYTPVPPEDSAPFRELDPTVPAAAGLDTAQVKQWTREYYAAVHAVDRNIGRLLAALERLGLEKNTIVLFTSDHGYMIGHHGLHTKGNGWWIAGGLRGPQRPNMFDDSLRIPLIVRWPDVVAPASVVDEPVAVVDMFASVLGMLGIGMPANVEQQGLDFSPLLRGQRPGWRDAVFGQYDLHNGGLAHMRMIRTAGWKLVRHHLANFLDELYDLGQDPGETRNLYVAPQHSEVRDRLQQRLSEWQREIRDPLLDREKR